MVAIWAAAPGSVALSRVHSEALFCALAVWALVALVDILRAGGSSLLDVQWATPHMRSLGAVEVSRSRYLELLGQALGRRQPGHLWRWELAPLGASRTLVTHTYDWTLLADQSRLRAAKATTSDRLRASLDRLAALAETS